MPRIRSESVLGAHRSLGDLVLVWVEYELARSRSEVND
jgi:hypothetical protein